MFKFLLEGALGEMLAPVTGAANQLNLAIQHHRHDEVNSILARDNVDLCKNSESGYGPLHVACRYNNQFVFDLCLSRGVPVDVLDSNKNRPLHYAAKYGNIELCRALVSKGASLVGRNSQNQTPYDAAEGNHTVRQFLLPLQLQAERQSAQDSFSFAPSAQGYISMQGGPVSYPPSGYATDVQSQPPPVAMGFNPVGVASNPNLVQQGANSSSSATPSPISLGTAAPPQIFMAAPLNLGRQNSNSGDNLAGQNAPLGLMPPPLDQPQSSQPLSLQPVTPISPPNSLGSNTGSVTTPIVGHIGTNSVAAVGQPPSTPTERTWNTPLIKQTSAGSGRIIQPDGFHTSASDPTLQAKYGHKKEVINIAPPPTGPLGMTMSAAGNGPPPGPPQYSMFNGANSSASANYNRYVPYDPNIPTYGQPPSVPATIPAQPSLYGGIASSVSGLMPTMMGPPSSLPVHAAPSAGSSLVSAAPYNGIHQPGQVPPMQVVAPNSQIGGGMVVNSRSAVGISVFNPSNDVGDIVTFDSNSKSIQ